MKRTDLVYGLVWLLLVGALCALLIGCHLGQAVQDLKTSGDGATLIGAIPGAIAGNPMSWYTVASILAGFLGTATVGHRLIAKRWPFQKSPAEIAADVVDTVAKDFVISYGPPPEKPN